MRSRSLFAIALLAGIPAMLMAKPTVKLAVPPPERYGIEDLWKATVTSDSAYEGVWFEGFVFEASRGQVFWAKTRSFPLPRGTKAYQYRDVKIERTETASGFEVFVTRSGQLPAGKYRFKLILQPFGAGDSFTFEAKPMGPPRLIAPKDGDTIKVKNPQFTWAPPSPLPAGGVSYELKLVEIRSGQSAQEALDANPVWFEKKDIRATSLIYPTSARQFEYLPPHKAYAWQVTAKTRDGAASRSEARAFRLVSKTALPPARWWQCDKDDSHFWEDRGGLILCPEKDCGGGGKEFVPPTLVNLFWDSDTLVIVIHVKQKVTVKSVRVVVSWASSDGKQAADAEFVRLYEPPGEHEPCDTLTLRAVWPRDFKPLLTIKPPSKDKLELDRIRVMVQVNGQKIAVKQKPAAGPPGGEGGE